MEAWSQNTADEKELSLGLLRQRRALILISIILPFFIFGFVTIKNIDMFGGVNIDIEKLNIKYILAPLLLYFWMRYCQYSKVDSNRKILIGNMKRNIGDARKKFFEKIACPSAKDCFDVAHCHITEKEDLPKSKNNKLFSKDKNIEIHGVAYRYEDYFTGTNHNKGVASTAEIEKIKQEGWQLLEIDEKIHESRGKPIFTKTFAYNWLKLKRTLCWVKLKFYWESTYFTDYLLPYYLAVISLSIFIVAFFGFV